MKLFICTGMLMLIGTTLSFAGLPALLNTASSSPLAAIRFTTAHPPLAFDDFGGKKKKKKKKSGHAVFQQGGGISLLVAPSNASDADNHAIGFGLSYFPSLRLAKVGHHALRLAFSPSIYSNLKFNSREGVSSTREGGGIASFLLDLPLGVELHLGDPAQGSGFGGHVGAGFGYNHMSSFGESSNTAFGPYFSGGARWNTLGRVWGLRAGFLLNIRGQRDAYGNKLKNVFSLALCTYF